MSGTRDPTWERWDEVDLLLAKALDLPLGDRERLLASRAGDDPELVETVRKLLDRSREAEARFAGMGSAVMRSAFEEDPAVEPPEPLAPGSSVGRYTVLEQLGRGGMATVYLAERADGAFRQQVALKVLRRGLDTEEVVRRFLAERQILSGLTHPNIARLLDGGATGDGRPFLVMERVEGDEITAWAEHRDATVRQRLALFLQVAEAVQFAHQHLVVHRDIKPSNVLVDRDGQVKLLDFGIAKLLDAEGDAMLTRTGTALPLTPEYASPEQLLGEAVTTASDVFQLGALLYLLLTGRSPFTRSGTAPTVAWIEDDVPPPSSVARRGRIAADLDLVVLKALRREPDRRFASVEALAEDVRRYLDGRPILARPDSVRYRASMFVRRHPAGVASAAVALGLITTFAGVVAMQAKRLSAERERVRLEAAKTAEVRDFVTGLFSVSDPDQAQGDTITARELLDSGAARVRRELTNQPEVRAEMLATIGRIYARLGMFEQAGDLLEDAVSLYETSAHDARAEHIEALRQLASVVWRDDAERGAELIDRAIGLAEEEHGPDSPTVAELLTELAQRSELGARKDSIMDRAVAILRTAPGDHRAELANALAVNGYGRGGTAEAIAMEREALAIRRDLYGELNTGVAASLSDLALALQDTDPVASDSLLSRALAIDRELLGERHTVTMTVMNNLAGIRRDLGRYQSAEPLYREILRLRREVYPGEWQQAYPLHGLGWVLTEEGRAREAEPYLREALRILRDRFPADHALVQITRSTLGRCLARQGRYAEAEPLVVGALETMSGHVSGRAERLLRRRVVDLYREWGRPADARRFESEAGGSS